MLLKAVLLRVLRQCGTLSKGSRVWGQKVIEQRL